MANPEGLFKDERRLAACRARGEVMVLKAEYTIRPVLSSIISVVNQPALVPELELV